MSKKKNSVDTYNDLLDDMFSKPEEVEEVELTEDKLKVKDQDPKKDPDPKPEVKRSYKKKKRKPNKSELVAIRFTEEELNNLKAIADKKGDSVSDVIRKALIKGGLI